MFQTVLRWTPYVTRARRDDMEGREEIEKQLFYTPLSMVSICLVFSHTQFTNGTSKFNVMSVMGLHTYDLPDMGLGSWGRKKMKEFFHPNPHNLGGSNTGHLVWGASAMPTQSQGSPD